MSVELKCDCGCGQQLEPRQCLLFASPAHALRGLRARASHHGVSKSHLCKKGDLWLSASSGFEIVAERSSENGGRVVFLWEDSMGRLGVWSRYKSWKTVSGYSTTPQKARDLYEQECRRYGCEPYPHA